MGEWHEDQHLVRGFLDDFQHHVKSVGYIELYDFSSIRIDRTTTNLEQLVNLNRCVDCANLFSASLNQHLVLELQVVLLLLRCERCLAFNERNLWQVEAVFLLKPDSRLQHIMDDTV